jgi:hypothetical protein
MQQSRPARIAGLRDGEQTMSIPNTMDEECAVCGGPVVTVNVPAPEQWRYVCSACALEGWGGGKEEDGYPKQSR